MSTSDRDLEEKLAKSGEGYQPPHAWQEQVWRQAQEATAPAQTGKARWGFWSWPIASLAALMLLIGGANFVQQQRSESKAEKREVAMSVQLKRQIEWEQKVERVLQEIAVFQQEIDHAFAALESAQDERARDQAILARQQAKRSLLDARNRLEELQRDGDSMNKQAKAKRVRAKRKEKDMVSKCAKSNDPLCGM